jgi:hypothetical protein
MRQRYVFMILILGAWGQVAPAGAQTTGAPPATASPDAREAVSQTRLLGTVTAVDAGLKRLTLKAASGQVVTVELDGRTVYKRVPLGETNLDKAADIKLEEVSVGDRVLARGTQLAGGPGILARTVVVISGTEIQQKEERERAEWLKRGIVGHVTAVSPDAKEITLLARSEAGPRPIVVTTDGAVRFRRYAPESVRFANAREGSFTDLKVGDQVRALGERSADNTHYKAEQIVSGAFQTIGGRVTAVKADTGEVVITNMQTRQPLTVVVNRDALLRRLPPEVTEMLEKSTAGGAGGGNLQETIERLPSMSLTELKAGDAVLVSSIAGGDASRLTAIMLVTGVETFVRKREQQPERRSLNLALGLPSGINP